jgi:hypothetical protein
MQSIRAFFMLVCFAFMTPHGAAAGVCDAIEDLIDQRIDSLEEARLSGLEEAEAKGDGPHLCRGILLYERRKATTLAAFDMRIKCEKDPVQIREIVRRRNIIKNGIDFRSDIRKYKCKS